jgi:hypothetical protein
MSLAFDARPWSGGRRQASPFDACCAVSVRSRGSLGNEASTWKRQRTRAVASPTTMTAAGLLASRVSTIRYAHASVLPHQNQCTSGPQDAGGIDRVRDTRRPTSQASPATTSRPLGSPRPGAPEASMTPGSARRDSQDEALSDQLERVCRSSRRRRPRCRASRVRPSSRSRPWPRVTVRVGSTTSCGWRCTASAASGVDPAWSATAAPSSPRLAGGSSATRWRPVEAHLPVLELEEFMQA